MLDGATVIGPSRHRVAARPELAGEVRQHRALRWREVRITALDQGAHGTDALDCGISSSSASSDMRIGRMTIGGRVWPSFAMLRKSVLRGCFACRADIAAMPALTVAL